MGQIETNAENLFWKFQSSYNQIAQVEKKRLLVQLLTWAKEQEGILSSNLTDTNVLTDNEDDLAINSVNERMPNEKFTIVNAIQNLIERETYLKQIAENIEQVFWLTDVNTGRIKYVSPAFENIWGRSSDALYKNPSILIESVHPEDRVQVLATRSAGEYKPFNQIYRIIRPEGGIRWVFSRQFLILDENKDPFCLFCMAQDISDHKQVELTLRNTLDRAREQFNISHKMSLSRKPEAVLKTLMSAHELRSAQRAALLFFEEPKLGPSGGVEVIASWRTNQAVKPWLNETNLYDEPAFWRLFHSNKTVVVNEIQFNNRLTPALRELLIDGQIHTMVIFPLKASGNWLGSLVVYFNHDVVFNPIELRHLKVLINQATITLYNLKLLVVEKESRHEAERANEIKTEFLAMISHELRTPLTSIIGFTNTLLAEDVTWQHDEQFEFFKTIQQEAYRLQELIDHLLDLSRLEAGMLPITLKPHSLHEILKDATPQLETLTKGQTLTIELPDELSMINVDAKRISQVLVNLVRNASTYAPKGTEINISANTQAGFVQINVKDQGPGIPIADHKKVFKAFIRGQNDENGVSKGAGLGLAISKGLIEAHGGRIWIRSKNTPGATISFTVPIAPLNAQIMSEGERH